MQDYHGNPAFDIANRELYDTSSPGKLPFMRFHTTIQKDELLPLPHEHSLDYNHVHWEIERWTLFKALPDILRFYKGLSDVSHAMERGLIPIPDYISQINPPSLWAYYSTLPKFARDDPVVRNVVMAMEYHKPSLDIR